MSDKTIYHAGMEAITALITNIKEKYALLSHKHTKSDITDLVIDSVLSSTSANPVQNKTLKVAIDEQANIITSHANDTDVHFSSTERTKLSGIESGAQKNTVTGVKGSSESSYRTGNINITKANIGLGNVNNTSDTSKPVSTAQQAAIDEAKSSTNTYTDTKIKNMVGTSNVSTQISSHNTSTSSHSDIRELISDLSTMVANFLDVDDETTDQLSEVITLINNNKGSLESLTTSKINVSDIIDNLTTNSTSKVLSAKQGVVLKSLIDILQTAVDSKIESVSLTSGTNNGTLKLTVDGVATDNIAVKGLGSAAYTASSTYAPSEHDHDGRYYTESEIDTKLSGKANSNHGTHVTYDSTNKPKMDGTAAFGTSSSVARADHVHPTDTSRASQTALDTHDVNTTKHITSTERTNWNTAKAHADSAHAPSNAEKNQNAFSNIKVGSTTVAADITTDTLELVGSNVTITPDATNDKVTIAVADGTTSAKGIVQLTNSTSSTSTTTAATPNSVKSAYDLANTAKTNAATAQTKADSAYNLADSKIDSLSDLGITATATELNYMDGVTSNVQAQINSKAPASTVVYIDIEDNSVDVEADLTLSEVNSKVEQLVNIIDGQETLPKVTTVDNGSFLRVVNGAWAVATMTSAEEVAF